MPVQGINGSMKSARDTGEWNPAISKVIGPKAGVRINLPSL
jgi:hypothetical protein